MPPEIRLDAMAAGAILVEAGGADLGRQILEFRCRDRGSSRASPCRRSGRPVVSTGWGVTLPCANARSAPTRARQTTRESPRVCGWLTPRFPPNFRNDLRARLGEGNCTLAPLKAKASPKRSPTLFALVSDENRETSRFAGPALSRRRRVGRLGRVAAPGALRRRFSRVRVRCGAA